MAILFLLEQTNLTEKHIFSGSNFNFLTRHIFSQVVGGSGSLLKQRDFFRAPTPLHSRPWETTGAPTLEKQSIKMSNKMQNFG